MKKTFYSFTNVLAVIGSFAVCVIVVVSWVIFPKTGPTVLFLLLLTVTTTFQALALATKGFSQVTVSDSTVTVHNLFNKTEIPRTDVTGIVIPHVRWFWFKVAWVTAPSIERAGHGPVRAYGLANGFFLGSPEAERLAKYLGLQIETT